MGELVFIDVATKRRDVTVQEAWDRYLAARDRADETRHLEDGIAAGKAWREWVELFAGVRK